MTDPRMNEHEAERVRRWLAARDEAMPPPETDHIMHETLSRLPTTPQTRARFLGRWFDRGRGARRRADDHDHPPDSDRRSRLMYSATAITAAIAITAVAVNVIDTSPEQPAAEVPTHVVAADGSGDFSTISEAVAAAAVGDSVLVRPGDYVEAILIDKDITLAGDGPREDIVIRAPEDGPRTIYEDQVWSVQSFEPTYALMVDDTHAEVRGLTFSGAEAAVVIDGGSPTLGDLALDGGGLLIHSGSTATVSDSRITVLGILFADSEPQILGNVLRDGASIGGHDGGVIRDNVLTDPDGGISVTGTPLIEGNTVAGAGGIAISSSSPEGDAGTPVIRGNTISGSRHGIQVGSGLGVELSTDGDTDAAAAIPTVSGNDVSAELNAISVQYSDAVVTDNTVHDSWNGIVLFGGGSAEVAGNEVEVDGVGIDIGANTSPNVDGNDVCGGGGSIKVHDKATPSMGENTTCDDA